MKVTKIQNISESATERQQERKMRGKEYTHIPNNQKCNGERFRAVLVEVHKNSIK